MGIHERLNYVWGVKFLQHKNRVGFCWAGSQVAAKAITVFVNAHTESWKLDADVGSLHFKRKKHLYRLSISRLIQLWQTIFLMYVKIHGIKVNWITKRIQFYHRSWLSNSHTLSFTRRQGAVLWCPAGVRGLQLWCWAVGLVKACVRMSWTLCFLIVALLGHLLGRTCLGSAGALSARWQTAHSHTALQYHRLKCAHRNTYINTHTYSIETCSQAQLRTVAACKITQTRWHANKHTLIGYIMLEGLHFLY